MRAFMMCDGEEAQIKVFQEEEIQNLFAENFIDFGKTPASCSGILQSSDVSMFFKATKQMLKTVTVDGLYKNRLLATNLKEAFRAYRGQYSATTLSSAMESKVIDALQQIKYTISKTLDPDVVRKGYIDCGQDAPISLNDDGEPTFAKYETCMRKCRRKLTRQECEVMKENFEHFVAIMRQRGRITEAEMNEKGIPNYNCHDSDKKPKDQRALHKQRACVMNAEETVRKYIEYQQRKQMNMQALEERRLQQAATAEQRQAAKEAKEAEKRRRSAMSQ